MKKLLRRFIGTAPGLLVVVVATASGPVNSVTGYFRGAMLPLGTVDAVDNVQLDQWTFGSAWSQGGNSNIPLVADRVYRIEIAGSFTPFTPLDAYHDAECGWSSTTVGSRNDDIDASGATPDVYVAGAEVDWVPTNPSPAGCNDLNHTYTLIYTAPASGVLNLKVNDTNYTDNFGDLTARLYTATASDPGLPGGDADELVGQVTGIAGGAVTTVSSIVTEQAGDPGIDPDDPDGSVERKKQEAEAEAAARRAEAEAEAQEKRDELEGQAPDPDETIGDVERILEENDPGDPGGVDTGPVTEAVGAVLDEVEKIEVPEEPGDPGDPGDPGEPEVPQEVRDAADEGERTAEELGGTDLPNPVDELGGGDPGESPTTTSPTTTPTTSPSTTPTTSPAAPSAGNGGGSASGGSAAGSNSGGESGTSGSTGGDAGNTGSGFQVSDTAAPSGDAGGTLAPSAGGTATAGASVKGKQQTAEAGAKPTAAARQAGGSLASTEFAIPEIEGDAVLDDTDTARRRPVAPVAPAQGTPWVLYAVVIGVLFGTFEMGRRAVQRIRAERAYDTYGY